MIGRLVLAGMLAVACAGVGQPADDIGRHQRGATSHSWTFQKSPAFVGLGFTFRRVAG